MAKKGKRRRGNAEQQQIQRETTQDYAAGQSLIDQMMGRMARTSEEQSALDARKADYEASQNDPTQKALMSKFMSATEGISAPENQALRAQMIRSEQGQTQSAIRGMRALAGSAGMTGGALGSAYGNIYRNAAMARALGESDLVAKNIGLKQEALNAAGSYANTSFQNRLAASDRYATDTLAQTEAERENWMQTFLGGMGLNMSRRGGIRGNKLAKQALNIAKGF